MVSFEGPEKRLEIASSENLRRLKLKDWEQILVKARCSIIDNIYAVEFDSYLLSESSLFVYDDRIMVKTCGTTEPLKILEELLVLQFPIQMIRYSHRSFKYQALQPYPYGDYNEEVKEIKRIMSDIKLDHETSLRLGNSWFMYTLGKEIVPRNEILEITMIDLDLHVMKKFYKDHVDKMDLKQFLPTVHFSEKHFEPCGYSINAHSGDKYYTIHITPEPECSYVSFETNDNFTRIVELINSFNPGSFQILSGSDHKLDLQHYPVIEKIVNEDIVLMECTKDPC